MVVGQLLITSTVEICIEQLGRIEEIIGVILRGGRNFAWSPHFSGQSYATGKNSLIAI